MEIKLSEVTERRLIALAKQESTSPDEIIESLLNRHMHVYNTSVMETDDFTNFIKLFGEYAQEDLDSLKDVSESEQDEKMYKVFEKLYSHTVGTPIMMSDLYEIYKNA